MTAPAQTADKPSHANAFGFLRFLFASLVIVSHFPQFADGDVSREPLMMLTGTTAFGGPSVNCFFLISGYLVVASYCNRGSVVDYLTRRVARIVPGFVAACAVSIVVFAPLGGASGEAIVMRLPALVLTTVTLQDPIVPEAFAGTHSSVLNGSMWTIAHEFRAYLLVALLGLLGLFRVRLAVPILAAILFACTEVVAGRIDAPQLHAAIVALVPLEELWNALRLTAIFLVGSSFYLYRDRIVLRPAFAVLAALVLVPAMSITPLLVETSFAVLVGYIVFTIGFGITRGPLIRFNNATDISYGIYLYGWPVGKLLLWFWPTIPLFPGILANWLIACALGWASWRWVEKPAMAKILRCREKPGTALPVVAMRPEVSR